MTVLRLGELLRALDDVRRRVASVRYDVEEYAIGRGRVLEELEQIEYDLDELRAKLRDRIGDEARL